MPLQGFLKLIAQKQDQSAEIAIILGRGPETREELALAASALWANNEDLSFFVSGMTDAPEIISLLVEMGVPETQIKGERCSQTTWENALFSKFIINSGEKKRILLITDRFHMPRAFLVFKGFGFDVEPYTIQPSKKNIFFSRRTQNSFREYAALISYGSSGKFRTYSAEDKRLFEVEANQKISSWGCQLN